MIPTPQQVNLEPYPLVRLPLSVLAHYLFFLYRRPISRSNRHYLDRRLQGLRTLSEFLEGCGIPYLEIVAQVLCRLNPSNFQSLGERLQYMLVPLSRALEELPADVIVTQQAPREILARAEKILLVCGPAIGVGDEIILFPLPLWIKSKHPDVTLTVMSAYPGLWNRVLGVDRIMLYGEYAEMVRAVRGEMPGASFDTVILADFDRPGLAPAVCFEGGPPRYIELSLGTQSLFVVDTERRTLYRTPPLEPYFGNCYFGSAHLVQRLGLHPHEQERFGHSVARRQELPVEPLRVFVSPFTSKYNPSELYWSRLLSLLLSGWKESPVQVVMDSGPNALTSRFVARIIQSAMAHMPSSVRFELAGSGESSATGLEAALSWIEDTHVVICADSYAAHASPLFRRLTCVVASAGLENWRVPHQDSYYLSADEAVHQVAAAIGRLIHCYREVGVRNAERSQLCDVERELIESTAALQVCFASDPAGEDFQQLLSAYNLFVGAHGQAAQRITTWNATWGPLARDCDYGRPLTTVSGTTSFTPAQQTDLARHLQHRWQYWHNSNVCKYLGKLLEVA